MRCVSACEDAGALFILCVTGDGAIFSAKIYETQTLGNGNDKWLSERYFYTHFTAVLVRVLVSHVMIVITNSV